MTDATYLTLASAFQYEPDKIKGSRFIADVAPAANESEALAFLEKIRGQFRDARHHCFAWRLGPEGKETRFSDDGEPAGSAGKPILAQLEGHEITDLCCVVTRYFGGTKLGVGGLVRAYGGAAGMALDRAPTRTVVMTRTIRVEYPYAFSGKISGLLAQLELEPARSQYAEIVTLELQVPLGRVDEFLHELSERTAGRAKSQDLT